MRVTVAIPIYNAAETLPDAIRSVFAQEFEDWELLLVEDGSQDGSLDIARSVRDDRVRVIADGVNRGLVYRLNQIAREARGEYLARMDADDMMAPERLALQAEVLDRHPDVDVVDTGAYSIDPASNVLGARGIAPIDARPGSVLRSGLLFHPTILGRTEWFRRNPYDERFPRAEDFELWCRTCQMTGFERIARPLYYYREEHRVPEEYLKAYLLGLSSVRRAVGLHGPGMVGWAKTAEFLLTAHAKGIIYRAATALGRQRKLVAARSLAIGKEEQQAAEAEIRKIRQTNVPGLPERELEATYRE